MNLKLLSTRETAEALRRPEATLRYWRHCGTGPRSFKMGRRVMYSEDDVTDWLARLREGGQGGDAA